MKLAMVALPNESELLRWAESLRPVGSAPISMVQVANNLGTIVSLRLHTTLSRPAAQIDMRQRPAKIVLYRQGKVDGEREIRPQEESLLTPRERFSVAHELGHWILFRQLGVGPQFDKRKYWYQEHVINDFAGYLLAPDWLVMQWLSRIPEGTVIPPFALKHWASSDCGASEEVVAKRLVRQRDSIGFLRVLPIRRKRDGADVLQVICSAAGESLRLPHERSYVETSELWRLVRESKVGSATQSKLQLGRCKPQDLQLAWRRGNQIGTDETIWISLALASSSRTLAESSPLQLAIDLSEERS